MFLKKEIFKRLVPFVYKQQTRQRVYWNES